MATDLACKPCLLSNIDDYFMPSVNSGFKFAELEISKHIPSRFPLKSKADNLHRSSPCCVAVATPNFSLRNKNRLGVRRPIQPDCRRHIAATKNAVDGWGSIVAEMNGWPSLYVWRCVFTVDLQPSAYLHYKLSSVHTVLLYFFTSIPTLTRWPSSKLHNPCIEPSQCEKTAIRSSHYDLWPCMATK